MIIFYHQFIFPFSNFITSYLFNFLQFYSVNLFHFSPFVWLNSVDYRSRDHIIQKSQNQIMLFGINDNNCVSMITILESFSMIFLFFWTEDSEYGFLSWNIRMKYSNFSIQFHNSDFDDSSKLLFSFDHRHSQFSITFFNTQFSTTSTNIWSIIIETSWITSIIFNSFQLIFPIPLFVISLIEIRHIGSSIITICHFTINNYFCHWVSCNSSILVSHRNQSTRMCSSFITYQTRLFTSSRSRQIRTNESYQWLFGNHSCQFMVSFLSEWLFFNLLLWSSPNEFIDNSSFSFDKYFNFLFNFVFKFYFEEVFKKCFSNNT